MKSLRSRNPNIATVRELQSKKPARVSSITASFDPSKIALNLRASSPATRAAHSIAARSIPATVRHTARASAASLTRDIKRSPTTSIAATTSPSPPRVTADST